MNALIKHSNGDEDHLLDFSMIEDSNDELLYIYYTYLIGIERVVELVKSELNSAITISYKED